MRDEMRDEMRDASPRREDEWPICLEATSHSPGNNNSADDTDTLPCSSNRITETERPFSDASSMHANPPYDQEGSREAFRHSNVISAYFLFRERQREREILSRCSSIRETTGIIEKTFSILGSTNSIPRSSENNDRAIKTYFDARRDDEEGRN